MSDPQILFLDIETTPILGYTWGKWQQNVIRVRDEWWVLCFSYAWGNDEVSVVAQPDFKRSYQRNLKDDRQVVQEAWKLLNKADIVVGHNVDKFDLKKLNARFMAHELPAPAPFATVDTLKAVKKVSQHTSHRLDDLTKEAGLQGKTNHSGFDTWLGCMAGADWAWAEMVEYAARDTEILRDYYYFLRENGWISNHPNMATISGNNSVCPRCGVGGQMHRRGVRHSKTITYQRYQCMSCKSYSSERKTKTGPRFA